MVRKQAIEVPELADSTSKGYEQCIRVGDWISVAGQTGIDAESNLVSRAFAPQAEQAFSNIQHALRAAGGSLDDLVHMRVFLTDMRYYDEFVEVRGSWLGDRLATSTLVGVDSLADPALLVEIEARAHVEP